MIGSGRTEHRDTVLGLDADIFLDLQRDRLEDVGKVDVVFDVIGGEILKRSATLVRPGGALITIAEPPQVQPEHGRAIFFVVEPDRASLAAPRTQTSRRPAAPDRRSGMFTGRSALGIRPRVSQPRQDHHRNRRR